MKKFTKAMLVCTLILAFSFSILLVGCAKEDLESLKIHTNFKTEYYVGESLDVTNGKLIYTDSEGKETIVSIQESMITSFSTDTEGEREMIITYNGQTITYDYVVKMPVDVSVGDLYYLTPSIISTQQDMHDYIYIVGANVFAIGSTNVTPENMSDNYLPSNNFNFTRTIENKKVVYTHTVNNEYGSGTYSITVENENQITLSIVGSDTQMGVLAVSGTFTKLVK